jgi:hypothetical protein
MSDKDKTQASDIEAFTAEGSTVIINDEQYTMRRLGIKDTFKLARIVAIGAAGMGKEIGNMELNAAVVGGLLLVGFPYAEKEVLTFLADIIGVSYDDITDPRKFPMGSEVDLINALVEHIDVKAFFGKVLKLVKSPMLKELSKGTSTSSKKGTNSPTSK